MEKDVPSFFWTGVILFGNPVDPSPHWGAKHVSYGSMLKLAKAPRGGTRPNGFAVLDGDLVEGPEPK